MPGKQQGKCRWFNSKRGYGFIDVGDETFFVHQSNIQMDGYRKLRYNQECELELGKDDQGRQIATNVVPLLKE
jgi:cold shock CspA family protein